MGMKHLLFALCLGLYAPVGFALKISGTPSGVSNFDPATSTTPTTPGTTTTNTTPTIYGGVAGSSGDGDCPNANGTTTCNSCTGNITTAACNSTRIYDNLLMVIPLTDVGNGGVAHLRLTNTTNTLALDQGNSLTAVSVFWGDLCVAAKGTSCDSLADDFTIPAEIWIETDGALGPTGNESKMNIIVTVSGVNTTGTGINACAAARSSGQAGVCFFKAYPGDRKVYLTDLDTSGTFPGTGARKFTKMRLFLSSTGWNNALPGRAEHEIDLALDANGDLADRRVRGLENGISYFIRSATLDMANNVDAITSDNNILDTSTADCGVSISGTPTTSMDCAYYAKPDEVLGLLSEDMNCFIATAAYGSQTEKYLDLLREFRFQKLIPTEMGRQFVYQYYKYGPYAAKFITEHPWLKPVTRAALWPVISFSWLVLQYGWTIAIGIYAVGVMLLVVLIKAAAQKVRQGSLSAQ